MSNLRRMKRKKEQRYSVSNSLFHRMAQENQDVLQNIEFVLMSAYRNDPEIDDKDVAAALKTALAGEVPEDEAVRSLVEGLAEIRRMRADISDDLWIDGLKVVLESVHNHSHARSGDRGYLKFVQSFMPKPVV